MRSLITLLLLLISVQGYSQWSKEAHILNSSLYDIDVVDWAEAYVAGSDSLSNINNGMLFHGFFQTPWDTIYHNTDSVPSRMLRVQAINDSLIYATGMKTELYKSVDAGATWTVHPYPTTNGFGTDALFFMNKDTGFVGNLYGEIFKTVDGGQTWNLVHFLNPFNVIYDIDCPTVNTCYARTTMPGKFLKSTDGGDTWITLSGTPNTFFNGGMAAINEDTIVMVSSDSMIIRSIDGGLNWNSIASPADANYHDVHFVGNTGFAVGSNETIIHSWDAGLTWNIQNIDTSSNEIITAVDVLSWYIAMACSDQGSIYLHMIINSVEEEKGLGFDFNVYPNPSSELVKIEFDRAVSGQFFLYDMLGREKIRARVDDETSSDVDIGDLSSGMYVCTFVDGAQTLRRSRMIIKK